MNYSEVMYYLHEKNAIQSFHKKQDYVAEDFILHMITLKKTFYSNQ